MSCNSSVISSGYNGEGSSNCEPQRMRVCIFCYKTVNPSDITSINENNKRNRDDLNNIIKLLGRYLGSRNGMAFSSSPSCTDVDNNHWNGFLNYCKDCQGLSASFCSLYHQLKYLELQLEWKLKTLLAVMKMANKVPSRLAKLTQIFEESGQHEGSNDNAAEDEDEDKKLLNCHFRLNSFKRFRADIIKAGIKKFSRSLPKVQLERLNEEPKVITVFVNSTCSKSESTDNIESSASLLDVREFGCGWIASLAAVVFLAVTSMNNGGTSPVSWQNTVSTDRNELHSVDSANIKVDELEDVMDEYAEELSSVQESNLFAAADNVTLQRTILNGEPINGEVKSTETTNQSALTFSLTNENYSGRMDNNESPANAQSFTIDELGGAAVEKNYKQPNGKMESEEINNQCQIIDDTTSESSLSGICNGAREEAVPSTDQTVNVNLEKLFLISAENAAISCKIVRRKDSDKLEENSTPTFNPVSHTDEFHSKKTSAEITKAITESISEIKKEAPPASKINKSADTVFWCMKCAKSFRFRASLKRHNRENHSFTKSRNRKIESYNCEICQYSGKNYLNLRVHKMSKSHQLRQKIFLRKQQTLKAEKREPAIETSDEHSTTSCDDDVVQHDVVDVTVQAAPSPLNLDVEESTKPSSPPREHFDFEATSVSSIQRYNLRTKGKRFYGNVDEQDEKSNDEDDDATSSNFDDKSDGDDEEESSISSSGTDVDMSSTDSEASKTEEEEAIKPKIKISTTSKFKKKDVKPKHFYCSLDRCNMYQGRIYLYEEHQKLHAAGEFLCKYCDIVETNVTRLSFHEMEVHPRTRSTEGMESSSRKIFHCSRCPFETSVQLAYIEHFAEKHIGCFRKKVNSVECSICKCKVDKRKQEAHFKSYHDMTGMDAQTIKKCSSCPAFFKTDHQRNFHRRVAHFSTISSEEDENDALSAEEKTDFVKRKGMFKCKWCGKKFLTIDKLNRHKILAHDEIHQRETKSTKPCSKPETRFICGTCKLKCPTKENLENHQKLHGSFKCKYCEVVKEYAPDLSKHETEHAIREGETKSKEPFFHCARCPLNYTKMSLYVRHHLAVHLGLNYNTKVCLICKEEGYSYKFLYHHFRASHKLDGLDPSQIYRCDQCPAYFIRKGQVSTHKWKVHNKLIRIGLHCPECNKSFNSESNVRAHMNRLHPHCFPDHNFHCEFKKCKQRFATQEELDRHKNEHENKLNQEKCLKCPECAKMFKSIGQVNSHVKRVHCARSHICSECGKTFKSEVALKTHMLYHKPDSWKFQCSTCGRKFACNQKLRDHANTHSKAKNFVCQFCGEKYAHRHNWRNHMKTRHKNEWDEQ